MPSHDRRRDWIRACRLVASTPVVDDAKVIEQGTPAELLAQPSSLYRRLWEDYNKVLEE